MRILFPVSEATPIYKTGGLGDVAGSLPIALNQLGHEVILILPRHPEIELNIKLWKKESKFEVIYDHQIHSVTIYQGFLANTNIPVYLFDEPKYLCQTISHPQNKTKEIDKFAFFSQAVATWICTNRKWHPQIIHIHDWLTALIPLLLKQQYPSHQHPYKIILTIHNLAYQGVTPTNITRKLGLDVKQCQILSWDSLDNDINILMEGIIHADLVNTVSPTYAKEILTPKYGAKLEPILKSLSGKLSGIINGIDSQNWNPRTDTTLAKNYTLRTWRTGKQTNKLALQKQAGLPVNPKSLLFGFIGRLDSKQKGVQLILQAITAQKLATKEMQLIILGTGDPTLEAELNKVAKSNPNLSSNIIFDNQLARRIYAGCDFVIIPSKFEPCGLIQMIAMQYGTIPIARQTGGLADTITEEETGFLFPEYNRQSLVAAIGKAVSSIRDQHQHNLLVTNCMQQDFSWQQSALEYVKLYEKLLQEA